MTQHVLSAYALEELARHQRDKVLERERRAFDMKWAWFWKCTGCGARVPAEQVAERFGLCVCGAPIRVSRYSTVSARGSSPAASAPRAT